MTLLEAVEAKLLTALSPLTAGGTPLLREIAVESFANADDLNELLERFRGRMPAGFLSFPGARTRKAPGPRVLDVDLDYSFLAGTADRRDTGTRRTLGAQVFELLMSLVSLQQLGNVGISTTSPLNFVSITAMEYADTQELAAILIRFTVGVRNWQINQPA